MKKTNILLLLLLSAFTLRAQENITLDKIYLARLFYENSVRGINWMNDGQYYTSLTRSGIVKYEVTTGEEVETVFSSIKLPQNARLAGYEFSADEQKILLVTEPESIYRRSFLANYLVYDVNTEDLKPLSEKGKQSNAGFSPDGKQVGFTRENNLFYVDLATMEETQVTTDGNFNEVINASTDWVYEEEFSITRAWEWAPDGSAIAFVRFYEADVPEYNMQVWRDASLYPEDYRFKYPKAGEKNSTVSLHVYDLAQGQVKDIDLGEETDIYLPRLQWTNDPGLLSVIRMNRLQNELEILHVNPASGSVQTVLKETSETYVDLDYNDQLIYLEDGEHFLRTSEQDGYKHIYLYNMQGEMVQQVTSGEWEVTELLGIKEGRRPVVYYLSTEESPLERHFYSTDLKGKRKTRLTEGEGTHSINMSPDFSYYIHYFSSPAQPSVVSLFKTEKNEKIKVLEDNKDVAQQATDHALVQPEFFTFTTPEGLELDGYMLKPERVEEGKKYPLLMFQYSGPGSQSVSKRWMSSTRDMWHQMLVKEGYLVAVVDGRGTGYRGKEFKHITYKQLGRYETEDQISAAKYLGGLDYIDEDRIGIWGWSYGGYMSSLAIMQGADIFKTAIAVAPVTSWRFYDTIYTERYLQRPQDNPAGYDDYSPVNHVHKLKGNFLLVHGTGDDNVHFQNSVALQNALIAAGKQFDSFYYPDKAHGISGGKTRVHLFEMMTEYVKENL